MEGWRLIAFHTDVRLDDLSLPLVVLGNSDNTSTNFGAIYRGVLRYKR